MHPNTNKPASYIGLIIIILILVIGAATYLNYNKAEAPSQRVALEGDESPIATNCGLTVNTPLKGQNVTFPVTITGTIDNTNPEALGCSWVMFEGQAGVAELFYETKEGWSLPVDQQPVTVANWMSTSTTFSTTLNFDNSREQLPAGYNFLIRITEENPSGIGEADMVEIPVVLE